eukprot:gnl/Trimastix_PCT/1425.p1 GENE.gnl/Trimastix_PCT/1425~~gnl/Trimastix_PCT/1425.p1  ORF type:complete len:1749 (-),score=539.23 gnl/Trimastix_PCT/1425:182-5428(-)
MRQIRAALAAYREGIAKAIRMDVKESIEQSLASLNPPPSSSSLPPRASHTANTASTTPTTHASAATPHPSDQSSSRADGVAAEPITHSVRTPTRALSPPRGRSALASALEPHSEGPRPSPSPSRLRGSASSSALASHQGTPHTHAPHNRRPSPSHSPGRPTSGNSNPQPSTTSASSSSSSSSSSAPSKTLHRMKDFLSKKAKAIQEDLFNTTSNEEPGIPSQDKITPSQQSQTQTQTQSTHTETHTHTPAPLPAATQPQSDIKHTPTHPPTHTPTRTPEPEPAHTTTPPPTPPASASTPAAAPEMPPPERRESTGYRQVQGHERRTSTSSTSSVGSAASSASGESADSSAAAASPAAASQGPRRESTDSNDSAHAQSASDVRVGQPTMVTGPLAPASLAFSEIRKMFAQMQQQTNPLTANKNSSQSSSRKPSIGGPVLQQRKSISASKQPAAKPGKKEKPAKQGKGKKPKKGQLVPGSATVSQIASAIKQLRPAEERASSRRSSEATPPSSRRESVITPPSSRRESIASEHEEPQPEPQPEPEPVWTDRVPTQFLLPGDVRVVLIAKPEDRLASLKDQLFQRLQRRKLNYESPAAYVFRVHTGTHAEDSALCDAECESASEFLVDESVSMGELPGYVACQSNGKQFKLDVFSRSEAMRVEGSHLTTAQKLALEIESLLGMTIDSATPEVAMLRQSMARLRREHFGQTPPAYIPTAPPCDPQAIDWDVLMAAQGQGAGPASESESPRGAADPALEGPPAIQVPPPCTPEKFVVRITLPDKSTTKSVLGTPRHTVAQIIVDLLRQKAVQDLLGAPLSECPDTFTLKVKGRGDYFLPEHYLVFRTYVQTQLRARMPVELSLVEARDIPGYHVQLPEVQVQQELDRAVPAPPSPIVHESVDTVDNLSLCCDAHSPGHMSVWDVPCPFAFRCIGVDGLSTLACQTLSKVPHKAGRLDGATCLVYCTAGVYHGDEPIAPILSTPLSPISATPRWGSLLWSSLSVSNLPRATRLGFTVWMRPCKRKDLYIHAEPAAPGENDVPLAWVNCQLFDELGYLRRGSMHFRLWPDEAANPIATCVENISSEHAAVLHIEFMSFVFPLVFPKELDAQEEISYLAQHRRSLDETPRRNSQGSESDDYVTPDWDAEAGGLPPSPPSPHRPLHKAGSWTGVGKGLASLTRSPTQPHTQASAPVEPTLVPNEESDACECACACVGPCECPEASLVVPTQEEFAQLSQILVRDPLYRMTPEEKSLLWSHRQYITRYPSALPKFLQAVQWNVRSAVVQAHHLIRRWAPMNPIAAMELLDAKFADPLVREVAVTWLDGMTDETLSAFLLQLIQVLKYELYHDSPLARFLMRRALMNPYSIGHSFFWHLKAEIHVLEIRERYGLLLEEYLRGCGYHRKELNLQMESVRTLEGVAAEVVAHAREFDKDGRKAYLHDLLRTVQLPPRFQLPLSQRMEGSGLQIEKCRVMDSKKLPLWLTFTNAEPRLDPIVVLFKVGDDIRQDQLTLQMIRIMDNLWRSEGLDLRLKPYLALSTGDEQGFIEVVLNSDTTANITKAAGGATAAFSVTPLAEWLRRHNPSDAAYEKAVETFAFSCAGYCVATYVLGIGDRHNDNVMMTRQGHLFHIDFGHFLGNFKKKLGFKRERAPFVFTPDFAHILGGPKGRMFDVFKELCARAYNILRKHAHMFINLFCMMLSTGIPELRREEDISYLQRQFSVESTSEQAAQKIQNLITVSLKTKTTQLNNMIHIMAH